MTLFIEGLLNGTDVAWLPFTLDVVLKVAVLLLVATAATRILRNASASLRHHVWTVAFAGALILPLLAGSLPSWRVAVPAWGTETGGQLAPREDGGGAIETARGSADSPAASRETTLVQESASAGPTTSIDGVPSSPIDLGWDSAWMILLLTWFAGTCVLLIRLGVGVLSAWWTSRKGAPVQDPGWLSAIAEAQTTLGIKRAVHVVSSPWVGSPMTWGLLRPVLLLPEDAGQWPADRRDAVALHELAHVKRRDCLVHLLAQATRAVHWVNPLVWIGAKRIQAERERACDDMVLMAGASNTDYAELLLDVARRRGDRHLGWAAVSMARPSELEGRLLAILDPDRNRRGVGRLGSLAAFVGVAAVAMPLAAFQAAPEPGSDSADARVSAAPSPASPIETAATPSEGLTDMEIAETADVETTVDVRTAERMEMEMREGRSRDADPAVDPVEDLARTLAEPQTPDSLEARYVNALAQALQHEQPDFRAEAARTLGIMESPLAVPALTQASGDTSADVRRQIAWALGMIESSDAVSTLAVMVQDTDQEVREQAVWALGMIESPDGVEPLLPMLQDPSEELRKEAAWALGMIESSEAIEGLVQVLQTDTSTGVRREAAWALGMIEDPAAAEALAEAIDDEDETVAREAMSSLARVLGG